MTQPNEPAFARPSSGVISQQDGLTKREYFAAHADIPWKTLVETLLIMHPDKKDDITMNDVFELQAAAKVRAADELIKALNKQP
jgi:hypothetical protein